MLAVLLPFAFFVSYSYMFRGPGHDLLHTTSGFLLLMGAVGVLIAAFAAAIFRAISGQQRFIVQQNSELVRLSEHLQCLNATALAVTSQTGLSFVLQRVVDAARSLFTTRYVGLVTVDEDEQITGFVTSGVEPETPIRIEAPLVYQGRLLGALYVAGRKDGVPFSDSDERVLETFAVQAAIAIESVRLYREVQVLATEAERQWIAREMHDGMVQVLAYVNAKAQAISQFLATGRTVEARRHLEQLAEAARGVYADAREGILGLRLQVSHERSLVDVLREYLQEYEAQTGIKVELTCRLADGATGLDAMQDIQVLRILQEALTNVRRHAEARAVELSMARETGKFVASIRDDGNGFDPTRTRRRGKPCFGLQSMRERAQSVGGAVRVESAPGQGTLVSVEIPAEAAAIHEPR